MVTTAVPEEVGEGSLPASPSPDSIAEARAQARESLTPEVAGSSSVVTDGIRRAGQGAVRAVALLDKPGSLAHSQPPTFKQAWDRHAECAKHYEALAVRLPRYWWGCFHLLVIMPPLYLALWLTESPARFLVAAAIIAAVWFWS